MNRTRAPAFAAAEKLLSPEAQVVILVPFSRTWYKDRATLVELAMWLEEFGITPLCMGPPTIHAGVKAAAEVLGKELVFEVNCEEAEAHLVSGDVTLVIALVARQRVEVETASLFMPKVLARGLPVLGLLDNDDAVFVPAAKEQAS